MGNVFGQLLLCKQITPDFKQEELCSIANDLRDIDLLTAEIQDLIPPRELLDAGTYTFYDTPSNLNLNLILVPRKSLSCVLRNEKLFSKGSGLLCCVSRPKYM